MYKVECDLCDGNDFKVLGEVKGNKFVKCNICGYIYLVDRFIV